MRGIDVHVSVFSQPNSLHTEDGHSKVLRNVCILPRYYAASLKSRIAQVQWS